MNMIIYRRTWLCQHKLGFSSTYHQSAKKQYNQCKWCALTYSQQEETSPHQLMLQGHANQTTSESKTRGKESDSQSRYLLSTLLSVGLKRWRCSQLVNPRYKWYDCVARLRLMKHWTRDSLGPGYKKTNTPNKATIFYQTPTKQTQPINQEPLCVSEQTLLLTFTRIWKPINKNRNFVTNSIKTEMLHR